jgi:hypothetical protein
MIPTIISINKKSATGEYLVSERGAPQFGMSATTYYTDDPADAVATAIYRIEQIRANGGQANISEANTTMKLISTHNPGWLVKETKRVIAVLKNA